MYQVLKKRRKMRVLIVHGWLHSAARYERLRQEIEKHGEHSVDLYEFPGFGDTPAVYHNRILKAYVEDMASYLQKEAYDIIIAHSMGGNVVLKVAENHHLSAHLILLSPEYMGITLLKPLVILYPVIYFAFWLMKFPNIFSRFFVKVFALFTINHWNHIDERIVQDARRANTCVSVRLLFELAYDNWRLSQPNQINRPVALLLGEQDRIISKKHMKALKMDLNGCYAYFFKKIGHTAVTENYEELLQMILHQIKKYE